MGVTQIKTGPSPTATRVLAVVESAALLVAWLLIAVGWSGLSDLDARGWAAVLAAGLLPAGVWLVFGSGIRGRFAQTIDLLIPAAVATALSPALRFAFAPPSPAVPVSELVKLAVIVAVFVGVRQLYANRFSPSPRPNAPCYFAVAATLLAIVCGFVFRDRPPTTHLWRDISNTFLRDAARIAVIALLAWSAVRSSRCLRFAILSARRRSLSMSPPAFLLVIAVTSILLSALFAGVALDRMPHIQDEIAIVFQAKVFATGRLSAAPPPLPEFFDQEFLVCDTDTGKWYGKYQPGTSALLAIGVPFGLEWMVDPLLAGGAIVLLFLISAELTTNRLARLVVVLAVVSPFWIMIFGSMMLHAGCLFVLLAGAYALIRALKSDNPIVWALLAGVLLGSSVLFRPLTGVILGGLVGVIALLARPKRMLRVGSALPLLVGGAIVAVIALAYNHTLTGDAWQTPFQKYSPTDRLGFGDNVGLHYWADRDRVHDAERADRNLRINFASLAQHLLGWPTVALGLAIVALAHRRRRKLVIALGMLVIALPIAYTFYLFHGEVFGPRYWSESMPAWFLLIAIGLVAGRGAFARLLRKRRRPHPAASSHAAFVFAGVLLVAASATAFWPKALEFYGYSLWQTDRAMDNAIRKAGIHNAVVFVKSAPYHKTLVFSDLYGNGFLFNTPTLDGDIVYARDLGDDNARLMAFYPDRRFYVVRPGILAESSLREIGPDGQIVERDVTPNKTAEGGLAASQPSDTLVSP